MVAPSSGSPRQTHKHSEEDLSADIVLQLHSPSFRLIAALFILQKELYPSLPSCCISRTLKTY